MGCAHLRTVIPIAWIFVSLEGSCFVNLLVYSNSMVAKNFDAIHRVLPLVLPSAIAVLLVVSSAIAASLKSTKRARHPESIRMLTLRHSCVVNQELTPLRSPYTMLRSCRYSTPATAATSYPNDRCDRRISHSLHSKDVGDCNTGWL